MEVLPNHPSHGWPWLHDLVLKHIEPHSLGDPLRNVPDFKPLRHRATPWSLGTKRWSIRSKSRCGWTGLRNVLRAREICQKYPDVNVGISFNKSQSRHFSGLPGMRNQKIELITCHSWKQCIIWDELPIISPYHFELDRCAIWKTIPWLVNHPRNQIGGTLKKCLWYIYIYTNKHRITHIQYIIYRYILYNIYYLDSHSLRHWL